VDGVCCDTACNGQCEACNVAGSVGVCSAVRGDPRGGRPACGGDGTLCAGSCDGSTRAACAYPDSSTQCRGASCSNGIATAVAACDGAGRCPARAQSSCGEYGCGPDACKTNCASDADCAEGALCVQGVCHSRNDPGIWVVAGTGCTQTGAAIWPLVLIVIGFALRRKRKLAVAALLVAASAARAQTASFAVDRFQPGAGTFDVLGVWSPEVAPDLDWHASAYTSYARDPLRLMAIDHPDQVQLLHGQSMLQLGGWIGLWDRLEVGAVLPIDVAQATDGDTIMGVLVALSVSIL